MSDLMRIFVSLALVAVSTYASMAQHMVMSGISRQGGYSYVDGSRVHPDSLLIEGRIVESLVKRDLIDAFMIPIDDDGNPGDTIKARARYAFTHSDHVRNMSYIEFMTEHKDSTYVFEIGCPGYTSQTIVYKVERLGKRELKREMPLTELVREPHKLGEVEVVVSKVKFFHKGDTLVYNADAFQLAEGSMLDALIAQLPGVELNSNGEIKVNGEKVESLLLNGKEFFDKDRNIMLENLGAYTVNNVEVYRGQTKREKWIDDPNAQKHLTMDVKLKKEYSMGWLLNSEAGYGTEDLYTARLFASWFSNTSRFTLLGNMNNVGNNFNLSSPEHNVVSMGGGRSFTPSGRSRYKNIGLDYSFDTNNEANNFHGSFVYTGDNDARTTTANKINFFNTGDTYEYSYSGNRSRNMRLGTSHAMMFDLGRLNITGSMSGSYSSNDNSSKSLSASFNEEMEDATVEFIENLYSSATPEELAAIINRNVSKSDSEGKSGNASFSSEAIYKVPGTSDKLLFSLSSGFSVNKAHSWQDYLINFGADHVPSEHRRQYTDQSPNRDFNISGSLGYTARIRNVSLDLVYEASYSEGKNGSYMYALHKLDDMGVYGGVLPPGYESTFDPSNSNSSSNSQRNHSLQSNFRYVTQFDSGYELNIFVMPTIRLVNRHLDYWRDSKNYNIRKNNFQFSSAVVNIRFGKRSFMTESLSHALSYQYALSTSLPGLLSLVDVVDDSNPLYISEGNPDLKSSTVHHHSVSWNISGKGMVSNSLSLSYSHTNNSIVNGNSYDTSTGVSRTRMYNVNGDNDVSLSDFVHFGFGKDRCFTLSSSSTLSRRHDVDMIGTNGAAPSRTYADTWAISENVNLGWRSPNFKHNVSIVGNISNNRTRSAREGANNVNSVHVSYGLTGMCTLPGGFRINTDLNFYTRRGYGSRELDTTDAMWNLSASYTPKGNKWVFTVKGFDILQSLSNVYYSVTASGRSVSYSYTLPRYVLFTAQYRLNLQPKKRM